ncbi:hypothetical protein CLOM_g3666 [Closterium sp. NIES-68]|nr:hypothetical protein CLOM_g3666 [Closterium sp. NIES-68]
MALQGGWARLSAAGVVSHECAVRSESSLLSGAAPVTAGAARHASDDEWPAAGAPSPAAPAAATAPAPAAAAAVAAPVVTVVAESFGAGVALSLAAKHPHLVSHLVICNSGSGFRRQPALQLGALLAPFAPDIPFLAQLSSFALAPLLSDWDSLGERERSFITPPFSTKVLSPATVSRRVAMMAALQPSDALLQSITASTLLIASGEDRLMPSVEEAYGLATCIPSCRIKILPFSGHTPLLESGVCLRNVLEECGILLPSAAFPQDPVAASDDEEAEPAYSEDGKAGGKQRGSNEASRIDSASAVEAATEATTERTGTTEAGTSTVAYSRNRTETTTEGISSSTAGSAAEDTGGASSGLGRGSGESSGGTSGSGVEAEGYGSDPGEFSMEGKDWDDADVDTVLGISKDVNTGMGLGAVPDSSASAVPLHAAAACASASAAEAAAAAVATVAGVATTAVTAVATATEAIAVAAEPGGVLPSLEEGGVRTEGEGEGDVWVEVSRKQEEARGEVVLREWSQVRAAQARKERGVVVGGGGGVRVEGERRLGGREGGMVSSWQEWNKKRGEPGRGGRDMRDDGRSMSSGEDQGEKREGENSVGQHEEGSQTKAEGRVVSKGQQDDIQDENPWLQDKKLKQGLRQSSEAPERLKRGLRLDAYFEMMKGKGDAAWAGWMFPQAAANSPALGIIAQAPATIPTASKNGAATSNIGGATSAVASNRASSNRAADSEQIVGGASEAAGTIRAGKSGGAAGGAGLTEAEEGRGTRGGLGNEMELGRKQLGRETELGRREGKGGEGRVEKGEARGVGEQASEEGKKYMGSVEGRVAAGEVGRALEGMMDDMPQYRVWNWIARPLYIGLEKIPRNEGKLLFVGNHTIFGIYDMPLMIRDIHMRTGVTLRGLGAPTHWQGPFADKFTKYGAVRVSPRACYQLLREGENMLLYPGGGREVAKRKGEKYKLMWRDTTDFVRIAIRCGATIVPFSTIGVEDAFDVLMDPEEIMASPLGPWLKPALQATGLHTAPFPLASNAGLLPRPERLYFLFSDPIRTDDLDPSIVRNKEECSRIYQEVRGRVESGIEQLMKVRQEDPLRETLPRIAVNLLDGWDGT